VTPEPVGQPEPASGVVVTAAGRVVCRAVGATAWAVLCDVTLDAQPDAHGRLVVATNVRRIADHLGISKDTAARALARLTNAGLIGRQSGRSSTGRFTASAYVVHLGDASGIILLAGRSCPEGPCPVVADTDAARGNGDTSPSARRRSSRPASSRPRRTPAEQASLFPAAGQLEDAR
jgi:DNA-binding transcriptional MocR family regulator